MKTKDKKEKIKEHYMRGTESCLVCDDKPLSGSWTDYNGQIKCHNCGTTYQILGCHLSESYLNEIGLKTADIAKKYCDCIALVPLLRDYWRETHNKIPLGTYISRNPIVKGEYESFLYWLKTNASKYEQEYKDELNWKTIKSK